MDGCTKSVARVQAGGCVPFQFCLSMIDPPRKPTRLLSDDKEIWLQYGQLAEVGVPSRV